MAQRALAFLGAEGIAVLPVKNTFVHLYEEEQHFSQLPRLSRRSRTGPGVVTRVLSEATSASTDAGEEPPLLLLQDSSDSEEEGEEAEEATMTQQALCERMEQWGIPGGSEAFPVKNTFIHFDDEEEPASCQLPRLGRRSRTGPVWMCVCMPGEGAVTLRPTEATPSTDGAEEEPLHEEEGAGDEVCEAGLEGWDDVTVKNTFIHFDVVALCEASRARDSRRAQTGPACVVAAASEEEDAGRPIAADSSPCLSPPTPEFHTSRHRGSPAHLAMPVATQDSPPCLSPRTAEFHTSCHRGSPAHLAAMPVAKQVQDDEGASESYREGVCPPVLLHLVTEGTSFPSHQNGRCTPCFYFRFKEDGCRKGKGCAFCHFCTAEDCRQRRKLAKREVVKAKHSLN